MATIVAIE
jgi:hypothetical protein